MKSFIRCMGFVAFIAILFTSCSREEGNLVHDSEKGTVSFGALLNDMVNDNAALKQQFDIPGCSDELPAYVEVVLSGTTSVGTMADPVVVSVNATPGDYNDDGEKEWFTDESSDLELEPGPYSLDFFAVSDGHPDEESSNMIWIAPTSEGSLADFVDNALPMPFDLGPGTRKYMDVEVLCFDDRMINEYGYQFFDIETNKAIEFCVFGNFCPPSGRHYPAAYSVDVWSYEDGVIGDQIHENLTANVAEDQNGDYAASPVCMALPDTEGLDEYYVEITLMSTDADVYGNVEETVIRSGVITDDEVKSLFDGENNLNYYHFREGCDDIGDDNPPIFQDPQDDAMMYKSCLTELNDSGALAFAYLRLEGNTLETSVYGFNLEANMTHPQHIHGLNDKNENSTCPPETAAGEDGMISLEEGLPFYGGVRLPLDDAAGDYPTADGAGMTEYHYTFELGANGNISLDDLGPLDKKAIVLHGMTVDGEYNATLPVACAEIVPVN